MFELDVFPALLENDLSKVDKILGLSFFRQEKTLKDSKPRNLFFSFTVANFFARCNVYNSLLFAEKRPVFLSPERFLSNK